MATETKRPTNSADAGGEWTDDALAYDTDLETFAYVTNWADYVPSLTCDTWQAKVESYSATKLYVKYADNQQPGDDDTYGIEYTKDGGNNYIDLVVMGVHEQGTPVEAQADLDADQDLSLVIVRVNTLREKGGDGASIYIYDIRTEGEYTAGDLSINVSECIPVNERIGE